MNLGSFLAMQGKLPDAVREFRRAVELNAGYTEAHRNLGRALAQMGQRAEASPAVSDSAATIAWRFRSPSASQRTIFLGSK